MPQSHDLGRLFVHRMDYPSTRFPLMERGSTQEIEWPFRTGRSVVMRLPGCRQAVVIGWWGEPVEEELALTDAIKARAIDDLE